MLLGGKAATHALFCPLQAIPQSELLMKTSLKKSLVLLVLAAFAAPTLSFAAADYPNNKARPAYHKKGQKHKHSKKSTTTPPASQTQ